MVKRRVDGKCACSACVSKRIQHALPICGSLASVERQTRWVVQARRSASVLCVCVCVCVCVNIQVCERVREFERIVLFFFLSCELPTYRENRITNLRCSNSPIHLHNSYCIAGPVVGNAHKFVESVVVCCVGI